MFSSIFSRSSRFTSWSSTGWPVAAPSAAAAAARASSVMARFWHRRAGAAGQPGSGVVVLTEAVHPDEVGRPDGPRWRSGDDDDEIARLVAAGLEHRAVALVDHPVGRVRLGHELGV